MAGQRGMGKGRGQSVLDYDDDDRSDSDSDSSTSSSSSDTGIKAKRRPNPTKTLSMIKSGSSMAGVLEEILPQHLTPLKRIMNWPRFKILTTHPMNSGDSS